MLYATFKTQVSPFVLHYKISGPHSQLNYFLRLWKFRKSRLCRNRTIALCIPAQSIHLSCHTAGKNVRISQVLNENARKPLSIGYLAFSLCSDILAALSVF